MARKRSGVTDEAIAEATGRDRDAWLATLDEAGAAEADHQGIVAIVADAGVENPWWHQTVAVGCEQTRGRREAGQSVDAGFQVGVQRTLPVAQDRLWALLVVGEGRAVWLGETGEFAAEPGAAYATDEGTTGEVRTVAPGERLRMTWRPADRDEPTTLQLTLACPRNDDSRTTLRFHHEKFADADEREAMRERWRSALDEVAALVRRDAG